MEDGAENGRWTIELYTPIYMAYVQLFHCPSLMSPFISSGAAVTDAVDSLSGGMELGGPSLSV